VVVVRASLEPRTAGLRVQHAYHSATLCNGKFTRPPAQVVQRMDNAIRQENRNHVSCELVLTNKLRWIAIYPADSLSILLNKRAPKVNVKKKKIQNSRRKYQRTLVSLFHFRCHRNY